MEHTKEPWRKVESAGSSRFNIYDAFCQRVGNTFEGVMTTQRTDEECEANARRIVACVNACAGVGTEYLEDNGPIVELVREHNSVLKQRDELLAAFEKFMDAHEECADFDGFTAQIVSMDDYHEAQEAIERAKGGAA